MSINIAQDEFSSPSISLNVGSTHVGVWMCVFVCVYCACDPVQVIGKNSTHVNVWVCECVCTCLFLCVCVVCVILYILFGNHGTHVDVCACVCVCVCVCVCLCMCPVCVHVVVYEFVWANQGFPVWTRHIQFSLQRALTLRILSSPGRDEGSGQPIRTQVWVGGGAMQPYFCIGILRHHGCNLYVSLAS